MRETIIGQKSLLFVNQITMGRLHCSLAPVLCGLPFLLSKIEWGIILMSDMSCIALLELDVTQTQLNRWKHDLAFVWCFELENRPLSFSLPHTLAWLVGFSPQNGLLFHNEETYRDMKCGFETQHYKSDFPMFSLPKYQFFSMHFVGMLILKHAKIRGSKSYTGNICGGSLGNSTPVHSTRYCPVLLQFLSHCSWDSVSCSVALTGPYAFKTLICNSEIANQNLQVFAMAVQIKLLKNAW